MERDIKTGLIIRIKKIVLGKLKREGRERGVTGVFVA